MEITKAKIMENKNNLIITDFKSQEQWDKVDQLIDWVKWGSGKKTYPEGFRIKNIDGNITLSTASINIFGSDPFQEIKGYAGENFYKNDDRYRNFIFLTADEFLKAMLEPAKEEGISLQFNYVFDCPCGNIVEFSHPFAGNLHCSECKKHYLLKGTKENPIVHLKAEQKPKPRFDQNWEWKIAAYLMQEKRIVKHENKFFHVQSFIIRSNGGIDLLGFEDLWHDIMKCEILKEREWVKITEEVAGEILN